MNIELYESLNEKQQRLYLGELAAAHGYGGIAKISREYNVSREKVKRGLEEYKSGETYHKNERIRAAGGGRKRKTEKYPELEARVIELAEANNGTYGSPTDERKWTSLSSRKAVLYLASDDNPIIVSAPTVLDILKKNHYSRQQNRKMKEVSDPGPYRDDQFNIINETTDEFEQTGDPIISIDTKKRDNR